MQHTYAECPYFSRMYILNKKICCETGKLTFPNTTVMLDFFDNHCATLKGCKQCSLNKCLTEHYNEKYKIED